ncbi:class I SAM-dependent methyltransferase [Winogradskyella ouciana]|uniref:class I SAM-dependent methyltransferase n=1 Tax=Winogradskyella ouciana TaxID=2608631 RepID=UPI003D27095C
MEQIYEKHLWGGKEYDFYSGIGSHDPNTINPYLDVVIDFLKSKNNQLTVCDLGCGDFNIGKHLIPFTKKYIGVDIVESLIERNRTQFIAENLTFQCLDIAKDELPNADCVILRQVLQHLSNKEIQQIVNKLKNYKYIILTEHLPDGEFIPNKDIISGQGIRLKQHSGVDVLAEPFKLKILDDKVLNEVILDIGKGRIVTTLYRLS